MCDNNNNNELASEENNIHPQVHVVHTITNQDSIQNMHQNMFNAAAVDGYFGVVDPGGSTLAANNFPEVLPPWNFPYFNPARDPDPFLLPPIFHPRYEPELRQHPMGPFGLHAELQKMSAQEMMDAKALAASKSHSEAERRRRERINNHLAKLRSLLPSTTKTDKASLLAEVIQHVKELKRQTSLIAETSPVPTETDELTVDASLDEDGKPLLKASICCEDRPDLLPDLIKTLKDLRLKTLKAEITTLGGRVKNVLFVTGDDEDQHHFCIGSIEEALKSVMDKPNLDESGVKRQRTNINIVQHRSL